MKKLMTVIIMVAVLVIAMAQENEPKELTQARAAYVKTLEGLKKTSKAPEAIQAEIDKVKVEAEAPAPAGAPAAPDKPGAKVSKIAEFPKDLTAEDWDKLPGKVIKVSAEGGPGGMSGGTDVTVKANEQFFAVPHPTDKWNLNKKVSCTWEGYKLEGPKYCANARVGYMLMYAWTEVKGEKAKSSSIDFSSPVVGPLKIKLYTSSGTAEWPQIYFKGDIRVKLVPAEQ